MKFIEFKGILSGYTIFSLKEIRRMDPAFHRRRLNEWQDKGYIKKIVSGQYIFSDLRLDENAIFEIANRIYPPSYISFEMALSYYGLIPESVYGVTSASTRRTYTFKTGVGEFLYRTIRPKLLFGYKIVNYGDKSFKIAMPEKALLDYFYIYPNIKNTEDYASLRFNKKRLFGLMDEDRMRMFLKVFAQRTLKKRIRSFWEVMKHA